MSEWSFIAYMGLILLGLIAAIYAVTQFQALQRNLTQKPGGILPPRARPEDQGGLVISVIGLTGLLFIALAAQFRPQDIEQSLSFDVGAALGLILMSLVLGFLFIRKVGPDFAARFHLDRLVRIILIVLSAGAVLTTFAIVLSLLFEAIRFFAEVPVWDFIFGTQWAPQTAIRDDQTGQSGLFGALPVFWGTFLIMAIAMAVAGPVGLMIAIYLSEYANQQTRRIIKPTIEILAGIPTVVYGFFALLTVGPSIRATMAVLGFDVPTQSAISAGLVMGIMIIPLVSSLSDDVINAVPQSLRDGSMALGATKSETMRRVVFAHALPGIAGSFLLAVSRAIGETMIVVMAAGRAANLTINPLESVTTVTVQIVTLLTGDQAFDSAKTLAAFALGFVLFLVTLNLNLIALTVVRRYQEQAG